MRENGEKVTIIQTDTRARAVLPGHKDEMFLMHENSDGSILLEPAVVISKAQRTYDESPELQDVLAEAMKAKSVLRSRRAR